MQLPTIGKKVKLMLVATLVALFCALAYYLLIGQFYAGTSIDDFIKGKSNTLTGVDTEHHYDGK